MPPSLTGATTWLVSDRRPRGVVVTGRYRIQGECNLSGRSIVTMVVGR